MRINKRLITLLVIILVLVVVTLAGCGDKNEEIEAVAKVNGNVITKTDFDNNFEIYKRSYEAQFGTEIWSEDIGNGKTFEKAVKESVLEKLITEEIILQKAEEMGIQVTEEQVEDEIKAYKQFFGSDEEYKQFLEENSMTEEYLKSGIEKDLIINRFKEDLTNEFKVTDEEAQEHFEENKDSYIQVRARHILVSTEEEAESILQQLKNGKDFAELAESKSIDSESASNGGDLGYFNKGQVIAEFGKVAFSLEPGKVSDIVKTDAGYHIIKVEDRKEDFKDFKDIVIEDINNIKYNEKVKELREKAEVEILIDNN